MGKSGVRKRGLLTSPGNISLHKMIAILVAFLVRYATAVNTVDNSQRLQPRLLRVENVDAPEPKAAKEVEEVKAKAEKEIAELKAAKGAEEAKAEKAKAEAKAEVT